MFNTTDATCAQPDSTSQCVPRPDLYFNLFPSIVTIRRGIDIYVIVYVTMSKRKYAIVCAHLLFTKADQVLQSWGDASHLGPTHFIANLNDPAIRVLQSWGDASHPGLNNRHIQPG